ncbi:hypothetical protein [Streptomyces narbonensis]|uniref:hypothetical protein n=1 Tax=Streptomyces narbonensis TaxID=67333 RepID=UPI0033DEB5D6
MALAQSQDHDIAIDISTAWWVVWPRAGEGYRIEVMDECPAASKKGLCKHPVGHLGDHWLFPPSRIPSYTQPTRLTSYVA